MTIPSVNGGPPTFEQAQGRRQQARAAGLHPDYWYAVEHDRAVKPGQVVEVRFWNRSIALYRTEDGQLAAVENRCPHRQLKLSLGQVEGCRLTCSYHGWSFDPEGRLAHVPHDLFGKADLRVRIDTYPLQVRYGLIWLFPGDPSLAGQRRIPDILELEGADRWASVTDDFTWRTHHSMIMENVCDLTHAHLHRRYKPFGYARLKRHEVRGDAVWMEYETEVGRGRVTQWFVDRQRVDTSSIELCYEYPYQWSNTGGKIKHWCFLLPMDEGTTRAFFIFYFEGFRIPLTPWRMPRWLMQPFLRLANRLHIQPLLAQDGVAVEAELAGYQAHYDAPLFEVNPVIGQFQQLTIRKWEDWRAERRQPPGPERRIESGERETAERGC